MSDTFTNAEHKVEDAMHTIEEDVHNYFYGGNNVTSDSLMDMNGTLIYPEDPEDTDCDYLMEGDVTRYWNTVFAMLGLFVAAFLLPYLFCCCNSRWPRCAAKWFFWIGMTEWVTGALLASSVLMPDCLYKLCGQQFCSAHKYNPGQVWGGVVVGLGFILHFKACSLNRFAKNREKQNRIASEEKGSLVSTIDTMMDESQRGYTDKEPIPFPDKLL